jgi:hypothetical protein
MSLDQNLKGWAPNTASHSPPANVCVCGRAGGEREIDREREGERDKGERYRRERERLRFF